MELKSNELCARFPVSRRSLRRTHHGRAVSRNKINREAAARYGINVGDVQDVIETAIGGKNLTTAIDGRQRLPVRVRYARDFRQDPEELRNNVLVTASNSAQIPLGQVADIRRGDGPVHDQQRKRAPARHRTDECTRA